MHHALRAGQIFGCIGAVAVVLEEISTVNVLQLAAAATRTRSPPVASLDVTVIKSALSMRDMVHPSSLSACQDTYRRDLAAVKAAVVSADAAVDRTVPSLASALECPTGTQLEPVTRTLAHGFDVVVCNYLRKLDPPFPDKRVPEMVDIVIEDMEWVEADRCAVLTRRLHTVNGAPSIVRRLISGDFLEFEEDIFWFPDARRFVVRARNVSFSSIATFTDIQTFSVHPDNPERTVFEQRASLSASPWTGPMRGVLERAGIAKFVEKAPHAVRMFEAVMRERTARE